MKTTSCGILIIDERAELLLGHATGTANWDIPKGGNEPGESPAQTALRETEEETGLSFTAGDLLELGRFDYQPQKDLVLFATLTERIDTSLCFCRSHFRDWRGRMQPEMDAFQWTAFGRVPDRCGKRMAALLQRLWLPGLLQRLLDAGHVARPVSQRPSRAGPPGTRSA